MKEYIVNIDVEDNRMMDKAWFEYNSAYSIANMLMKDKDVNFEMLQKYLSTAEARWVEVEKLKMALGKKYKPEEVDLNIYDFAFDFDESTIKFTEHQF